MAGEIGSVKATFTASAAGLVGAIGESVASLDSLRSAQQATMQQAKEYDGQQAALRASMSQSASAQKAVTQSVDKSSSAMREAARIAREVRTPSEKYAETVAKLDSYLKRGLLTQDVYNRAVARAKSELDDAAESANESGKALQGWTRVAAVAERTINGLSAAIKGVGDAVDSVATAGSSVIDFAARTAAATAAFRAFRAITGSFATPTGILGMVLGIGRTITVIKVAEAAFGALGIEMGGLADFATKATLAFGAFKIAAAAGVTGASVSSFASNLNTTLGITRGLTTVMGRLGFSAAATTATLSGMGAAGAATSAVFGRLLAFSIPGFGQLAATAYTVVKATLAARDTCYETAAAVAEIGAEAQKLGVSFQDVQIQKQLDAGTAREDISRLGLALSSLDAEAFDNLAVSSEKFGAENARAGQAVGAIGVTLASTFTGLFAGISDGSAAVVGSFANIVGGLNAIAAPIAQVLRPFGTLIGALAEGVLKTVALIGDFIAVTLRLAGAVAQIILAPVIVGFNNFADTIRSGVGAAFEYLSGWIDYAQQKITGLMNWMSKIPMFGKVFASSEGGGGSVRPNTENAKPVVDEKAAESTKALANEEAKRAAAIREGLVSPYEKMRRSVDELYELEKKGLLTAEERAAAEKKITDEYAAQTPAGKALAKAQADQKAAVEDIANQMERSAKAGADLGAAANPIKEKFKATADEIKDKLSRGLISPEDAKKQMADAVEGMNDELKKLGEDQKFAEKIREGLKSTGEKLKEELDAIEKNATLSRSEKNAAQSKAREKAKEGLPGGAKDPASEFRKQDAELRKAFEEGVISKQELAGRQKEIRGELEDSIADAKDKQERGKGVDRRAVGAVDVNSSEGASTFFRLLRGQDDPTKKQLKELEKQSKLLANVEAALRDQEVVQI
jgi:hypothetical protein